MLLTINYIDSKTAVALQNFSSFARSNVPLHFIEPKETKPTQNN